MKTLVIIPAYNEGETILSVVAGVQKSCPRMDVVVINDGSRDDTARICRQNGFEIIDLPVNLGLAGAVGAGMRYAYLNGYDVAIQFDGDGQHRPEYLAPLEALIAEGADIACASRFLNEKKPYSMRMLGSRLISWAIKMATGHKLTDPTSGLRAYNRQMIREYALEINHPPEPDTVSYLLKRGAIVKELQATMDERTAGTSYLNAFSALKYMLKMVISILLVQSFRGGKPIHKEQEKERGGASL